MLLFWGENEITPVNVPDKSKYFLFFLSSFLSSSLSPLLHPSLPPSLTLSLPPFLEKHTMCMQFIKLKSDVCLIPSQNLGANTCVYIINMSRCLGNISTLVVLSSSIPLTWDMSLVHFTWPLLQIGDGPSKQRGWVAAWEAQGSDLPTLPSPPHPPFWKAPPRLEAQEEWKPRGHEEGWKQAKSWILFCNP